MSLEQQLSKIVRDLRPRPKPGPAIPRVPGETGKAVMDRLPRVHTPELHVEEHKYSTYKIISLFHVRPAVQLDGEWAQFGVFRGFTARHFTPRVPADRKFHLFDSFEGLPEGWTGKWEKGAFDLQGVPPRLNLERCEIHKGWFSETVPPFAAGLTRPMAFMHLDADLYSSTIDVLYPLNDHIRPGTILLFDEYMMHGKDEEHRALVDWAEKFGRDFEYLWRTEWMQVAVRVTS